MNGESIYTTFEEPAVDSPSDSLTPVVYSGIALFYGMISLVVFIVSFSMVLEYSSEQQATGNMVVLIAMAMFSMISAVLHFFMLITQIDRRALVVLDSVLSVSFVMISTLGIVGDLVVVGVVLALLYLYEILQLSLNSKICKYFDYRKIKMDQRLLEVSIRRAFALKNMDTTFDSPF